MNDFVAPRGWRIGRMSVRADGPIQVRIAGLYRGVPHGVVATARCLCDPPHPEVPASDGQCGFHLDAPQVRDGWRSRAPFAIRFDVELYGRVIEHGEGGEVEGWRAEKMRVLGVEVPRNCTGCEQRDLPAERMVLALVEIAPAPSPWASSHPYCLSCSAERGFASVPLPDVGGALGASVLWEQQLADTSV